MRWHAAVSLVRVLPLLALSAAGGCTMPSAGIDVRYPDAAASAETRGSTPTRRIELRPVVDRRVDQSRIGVNRQTGEPIVTSRSVTEIIREALTAELARNGYAVVAIGGETALTADVEEFWLDTVSGYSSMLYVGRIVLALAVTDGRTGERLFTGHYIGLRRLATGDSATTASRSVMETALARTLHDVATDEPLARALTRTRLSLP